MTGRGLHHGDRPGIGVRHQPQFEPSLPEHNPSIPIKDKRKRFRLNFAQLLRR